MHIAYTSQIFMDQVYGGVSRYFARLCRELHAMGESPEILGLFHRNAYLGDLPRGITGARPVGDRFAKVARKINFATAHLRLRVRRPDVIHETYFRDSAAGPRGIPTVLTVYDMIHELFPEDLPPDEPTAGWKKTAAARADHIICISESTRRDLGRILGIPMEKMSVVHLAFDPMAESPMESAPPHPRPYLLYVGQRGGSYKNFTGLLHAYASSPRLRAEFDIVAFGGGPLSEAEKELIGTLGIPEQRIRQTGGSDGLLSSLYRHARVFVYPSLYEGFGLPPLEAMAQGCVVAASNTSSMPEVVGDAAELFDPTDTGMMARAIERAAFDGEVRRTLEAAGSERLGHFSWRKCAEETLAIYHRMADR